MIPWRTHFERAVAEARESGRPLWLQFTGSWCGFCRKMERETFPHPDVVGLGRRNYVPVQLDADARPDLLAQYGVGGLPATVLLDPSGRILARHEGFAEPGSFLALLRSASTTPEPSGTRAAPEIALAGFDPVSLVEGDGLAVGDPSIAVRYDNLEFRFVDADDREAFLSEPERFVPVAGGRCPVHLVDSRRRVPGDPRWGVYYRGRLYLCSDQTARQRFASDPARYADVDLANEGLCPHCETLAGRRVPGNPRFDAVYRGRRYLFPDAEHRAAFRTSPETYLR